MCSSDLNSRFSPYRVAHLDPADNAGLLVALTAQDDWAGAAILAEQLGGLALALQQASAFLARSGWSYRRFADRLRTHALDVLRIGSSRSFSNNHAFSVYTVWQHSIERSTLQASHARDVLQVLALLAAERIPRALFAIGDRSLGDGDELEVEAALLALSDYSLIELSERSISLHRLVQEVEVAHLREDADLLKVRATTAGNLLSGAMPDDPDDCDSWDRCAQLVPHVLNISGLLDPAHHQLVAIAQAETYVGSYLNARGFRLEAMQVLHKAVIRIGGLPESAVVLAQAKINLARVQRNLGDLSNAVVYAKESWEVAKTLSILGRVLMDAGDAVGAEKMYRLALDLVGYGSLATSRLAVAVLNHAARSKLRQRAIGEAQDLLLRALMIDSTLHTHPHADTAWTLDNLAMAKFALGDAEGAETDLRKVLDIEAVIHGAEHPRTAWSLRNLSRVLTACGDTLGARAVLLRSLTIIERATPNNRVELIATAKALFDVCMTLGDNQGARLALEQVRHFEGEAAWRRGGATQ